MLFVLFARACVCLKLSSTERIEKLGTRPDKARTASMAERLEPLADHFYVTNSHYTAALVKVIPGLTRPFKL